MLNSDKYPSFAYNLMEGTVTTYAHDDSLEEASTFSGLFRNILLNEPRTSAVQKSAYEKVNDTFNEFIDNMVDFHTVEFKVPEFAKNFWNTLKKVVKKAALPVAIAGASVAVGITAFDNVEQRSHNNFDYDPAKTIKAKPTQPTRKQGISFSSALDIFCFNHKKDISPKTAPAMIQISETDFKPVEVKAEQHTHGYKFIMQ